MAPAEPMAKPFEHIGDAPFFAEERKGWKGYVEWEDYPEKKEEAAKILAKYDFPVVSELIFLTTLDMRLTHKHSHQSFNSYHSPKQILYLKE
jgi:hypothetical protein